MTHDNTPRDDLHLHTDPETERIESLLDALASQDREAMSSDCESRVLESISQVFAPAPISIEPQLQATPAPSTGTKWNYRVAAAALLATATTLSIVATQPWNSGSLTKPGQNSSNQSSWSLASFEEDLDAYLSLNDLENDPIDEAVASWELWAQTIESEFDSGAINDEYGISDIQDGAL